MQIHPVGWRPLQVEEGIDDQLAGAVVGHFSSAFDGVDGRGGNRGLDGEVGGRRERRRRKRVSLVAVLVSLSKNSFARRLRESMWRREATFGWCRRLRRADGKGRRGVLPTRRGRGCRPAGVRTGGGGLDRRRRRREKNRSRETVREGGGDGDARERVGGPIPLHRERGRKRGRCGRGRRGVDVVGPRREESSLALASSSSACRRYRFDWKTIVAWGCVAEWVSDVAVRDH
mmetsp:Transcript_12300/g.26175  ORF Transcript_12300/g.26175 Transcript_12300/m.26175 type:complete len:231 (+) Transcript_12300:466-1158(+)